MDYKSLFSASGADAILITDPVNMRYVSGFKGGEGIVYISPSRSVLITDSRYTEAASKESSFELIEEGYTAKRENIISECINADGAKNIGYEDVSMRCSEFNKFKDALPQVEKWTPLGSKVSDLRRIKTPEEIENMRAAAHIADEALANLLEILKPGMTEKQIAAELEYRMRVRGAMGTSFDTIIASGVNSSLPHAVPSDKIVEKGDFITMDFGCLVDGYCSDMTRTIVLGKADEKQKEIYNTVLSANLAALEVIKAGVTGRYVDSVARDLITAAGYGKNFGHGLGHSVGLEIHENPRFSPSDGSVIEAGVIMTDEPGIYLPGWGGVRIEDMLVVTEDGYDMLSHSPKELIEL